MLRIGKRISDARQIRTHTSPISRCRRTSSCVPLVLSVLSALRDESLLEAFILLECGTKPISVVGGLHGLSCCGERRSFFWLLRWRPEGLRYGGIVTPTHLNTRSRNLAKR